MLRICKYCSVLLLLTSCTFVKFTKTMYGQPLASYYSFSKVAGVSVQEKIDTTIIYVSGKDLVRATKNRKAEIVFYYQYLKFSNNGMAFFSDYSEEPFTSTNIYGIDGQFCFYKIDNGELLLELYDHHIRRFTIMYAKIYEDRIHFYKDRLRIAWGGKSKLDMVYNKKPVKYTRRLVWPN